MLKITKTKFIVDGVEEPCIEVSNGYAMTRFHRCYHYVGSDTCYVSTFVDGDFNSRDEINRDMDDLSNLELIAIAKEFNVYLH